MITSRSFLAVYSGALTLAFACVVLLGARKSAPNATFDQITARRLNIVEPDGTMRMIISDKAEFPGAYFKGKEYARTDRDATGMLFNDEEGTENGGLIFGGKKDTDGTTHSWGHLSFDQYQRDQTLVMESNYDGMEGSVSYAVNDDDRAYSLTPEFAREWQRVEATPAGPARTAASKAWHDKYPGGLVNRAYLGRGRDQAVSLSLKDKKGRPRLVVGVEPNGTPKIDFLDDRGKVVRSIRAD